MGMVERRHRHIVNIGLALLHHSQIPLRFWEFASATTAFLYNRTPLSVLDGESPFQRLFQVSPSYNDFRVFGCRVYPNQRPVRKNKFTYRSDPHIFLGYPNNHRGYLCYDPATGKFVISRDCVFYETDFTLNVSLIEETNDMPTSDQGFGHSEIVDSRNIDEIPTTSESGSEPVSHNDETTPSQQQQRMITRGQRGIRKPNPKYVCMISVPLSVPTSASSALLDPDWTKAMTEEFEALLANDTWELVLRLPKYNVLSCK